MRQFPQEIYDQLDGIDLKLLEELSFLCKQQQARTGAAYCCPGRKYLAGKLKCDVGTISRHTTKIENLGILEKIQRRPIRGQWRSCLYKLKSWAAWKFGQIGAMLRRGGRKKTKENNTSHRVRLRAHIASVKTEIRTSAPHLAQKSFTPMRDILENNSIIQLWKQRGVGNG